MSTHQSIPKPANANKKSDILPVVAPIQSRPFIAQPKIESTLSNEEQLAQMRAKREAAERLGSTLITPELVPRKLPPLQPKLTIGQPGDQYEQEADTVARQVVDHINAPPKIQAKETHQPMLSVEARKPSPLDHYQVPKVQRYAAIGEMDASPDLESSIQRARGGGQPLDDGIRERMEGAFGADFSRVRVHTDGTSDQLNQSIQAKAFTTGQDVFFRKGAYNPGSRGGQELLAHELTHVVQQGSAIQPKQKEGLQRNSLEKLQKMGVELSPSSLETNTRVAAELKGGLIENLIQRTRVDVGGRVFPGTEEEDTQKFKLHVFMDCAYKNGDREMEVGAYTRILNAFQTLVNPSLWDKQMMNWLQEQIKEYEEQPGVDDDEYESISEGKNGAKTIAEKVLDSHGDYVQAKNIKQDNSYGEGPVCSELYEKALNIFDGLSEEDKDGYEAYSITAKNGQIDHVALLIAPKGLDPNKDIDEIVESGYAVDLWAYICCQASDYEDVFAKTLIELVQEVKVGDESLTAEFFVGKLSDQWKINKR
jgi:hypothetical protein